MSYVNFQSDDIAFDIDHNGRPGVVRITHLGEAFLIERGALVDGVYVTSQSEIIPKCDNPEVGSLYVGGEWDVFGLELLLCPADPDDLTLTSYARRQLAAKAV